MAVVVSRSVAVLIISIIAVGAAEEGSSCTTPRSEQGTCIKVRSCKAIIDAILTRSESSIDFARKSQCGYIDNEPLVCCRKKLLLPLPCGLHFEKKGSLITFGGYETDLREFPWMALLKYIENGNERFRCGGTLITERYVLTAAHCTKIPPNLDHQLIGVRLGEHNLSSTMDCSKPFLVPIFCTDPVVDVGIERVIIYPNYTRRLLVNDISLLRLERNVKFSVFVRPTEGAVLSEKAWLTLVGWGETESREFSQVKQRINLPVVNSTACGLKFLNAIADEQFCAGGVSGKDSCKGDSGGPLMRRVTNRWVQEGIVSYGADDCGIEGYPGVYTRVSKYVRWIVENLTEYMFHSHLLSCINATVPKRPYDLGRAGRKVD